jgi:hypothetical protein
MFIVRVTLRVSLSALLLNTQSVCILDAMTIHSSDFGEDIPWSGIQTESAEGHLID